MRRFNAILLSAIAASAAFVFVADAQAQSRSERGKVMRTTSAPPLTVRQRSFLNSGPIVSSRSMHNYVSMDTAWRQPTHFNQRGRLGFENLPGRFDPPGRASPLFEF